MTVEEAKQLRHRERLIYEPDGSRWYVNGEVKTWKRDPTRIRVPLKHGLFTYGYLDQYNVKDFRKEE
jgi:hypothetical protein